MSDKKNVAPTDDNVKQIEKKIVDQLNKEPRYRILIPSGRGTHERAPVMVGVNGYAFKIKRDCQVDVPESVVKILESAIERTPVSEEVNGQSRTTFKSALRFPFQNFGPVKD